jgi:hypothetical protein
MAAVDASAGVEGIAAVVRPDASYAGARDGDALACAEIPSSVFGLALGGPAHGLSAVAAACVGGADCGGNGNDEDTTGFEGGGGRAASGAAGIA